MTIHMAIQRTLIGCGILALAVCAGAAIVHAQNAKPAISASIHQTQSPRDPANLADRVHLDKLMTVPR